ncbi:MAG: carbohydrate kinase [Lachnospiraceae bacterium]|nr:carbohydrate kinase [Lachnospiraceae bacterium]
MNMKKYDVVALGELLIDFTENGESGQGNPLLEANPGGAPCNVLAMLNRLGKKTAFIGKVGKDMFGTMLRERVSGLGIDVSGLLTDEKVHTTLAFVHTYPDGDRDFSFYRNPGADMMLTADEVPLEMIRDTKVFHFGTLSMTDPGVEEATKKALSAAKESGALISFDPNLRPPLWRSMELAKEKIAFGLSQCDVLKISDNEIEFMSGTADIDEGVARIRKQYDIPLIFATMGKDGSKAFYKELVVEGRPFVNAHTIETTGAGDTFGACAISGVLDAGLENLDAAKLEEILVFANAAASLITTRKGALSVMPGPDEVRQYMKEMEE